MSAQLLHLDRAFKPVQADGRYAGQIEQIRKVQASGVYAIADASSRRVLYVGESHSGRLFDTITRHFRSWRVAPSRDAQGRRRGGTTYDRREVLVAYVITEADVAQPLQFAEISRLKPRDNQVEGTSVDQIPV